jgi:hypothetical protein
LRESCASVCPLNLFMQITCSDPQPEQLHGLTPDLGNYMV